MTVHLVPPTLTVLGRIISKRIPLSEHFQNLREWMQSAWSLDDCTAQGFPRLRFAAHGIGGGLAVGCTEDDVGILLYVFEVTCHPLCAVTSERKCTKSLTISEQMEMMKKRHESYLTILPGRGRLISRAISPKKGNDHE